MSSNNESRRPLLEEIDGPIVVAFINQLAESLDVADISTEAALLLAVVLDRCIKALWAEYPQELLLLYQRVLENEPGDDDDDDGSEPGPDGHGHA